MLRLRSALVTGVLIGALIGAGVASGGLATRPAFASGKSADCRLFLAGDLAPKTIQDWMQDEIASGRTHFVALQQVMCAS